jgi:hypothetical protein
MEARHQKVLVTFQRPQILSARLLQPLMQQFFPSIFAGRPHMFSNIAFSSSTPTHTCVLLAFHLFTLWNICPLSREHFGHGFKKNLQRVGIA